MSFSNFSLRLFPFWAYVILYDGNVRVCRLGNSSFSNCKASPSLAIIGSKLQCIKAFINGIHLVAWPKPQFKGAIKIRFLGLTCMCCNGFSILISFFVDES